MSQLDEIQESLRELSKSNRQEDIREENTLREVSAKNETDMFDISKDLASYFAQQKEATNTESREEENEISQTENVSRRVSDTNTLLQDSIKIQNRTLAEMGNVSQAIEKLNTNFPIWLREAHLNSTGAGGLAGLAEVLSAGGIASLLAKGSKGASTAAAAAGGAALTAEEAAAIGGGALAVSSVAKPSFLGRAGSAISNFAIGPSGRGAAAAVQTGANKLGTILHAPSVLGRAGSFLAKGLRAIPFLGDAYQGIHRGYESGSVLEGMAAAGGSLVGRFGGAAVGSVAGPVGTFAGEVGGSILGANLAGDAVHHLFNKGSDVKAAEAATIASTATGGAQLTKPNIYQEGGKTYTNIPRAAWNERQNNSTAPMGVDLKSWTPATEETRGTGIIPGVGIRSPSTMLGGSVGRSGGMEGFLQGGMNGSGGESSSSGEGYSGGSSHGGRDSGYQGGSGGKTRSSGSLAKNQQLAYNEAIKDGLSPSAAKIMVANMSGESLRDPSSDHWDRTHNSQGIVQWDPQRAGRIQKEFGKLPKDMSVAEQTKAAIWEMKTFPKEFPGAYAALTNEKLSDQERMFGVVKHYEKPQDAQGDTKKRLGLLNGLNLKEGGTASDGSSEADNIKGLPAGTPPEITKQLKKMKAEGKINGNECVALAQGYMKDNTNVHDWRKGEAAESGTLKPGTALATYLNRDGSQSDRYAGGGSGTKGAHLDHAAIFENYIHDKSGKITGMHVGEQYATSGGVREKDYMFGHGRGEGNASNYYAIKRPDGKYLGGDRSPMSQHMEASGKPTTKIARPAPPPTPEHKPERQMAKNDTHGDTQDAGGHYGGKSHGVSSKGSERIQSASVGPSWGDMVRSVTGSYGVA